MIKVDGHDDRGNDIIHFGFVYFNDGTRVVYGSGKPVTPGNWGPVTPKHISLAEDYLENLGFPIRRVT